MTYTINEKTIKKEIFSKKVLIERGYKNSYRVHVSINGDTKTSLLNDLPLKDIIKLRDFLQEEQERIFLKIKARGPNPLERHHANGLVQLRKAHISSLKILLTYIYSHPSIKNKIRLIDL